MARITRELRLAIEDAVAARRGGAVTLYDAALVNSAIRWERHSLLVQRWLRLEAAKLNPDQRLAYSREAARASSERDRCLRQLGLDRSEMDHQLDQLYNEPWPSSPDAAAGERTDPAECEDSGPAAEPPEASVGGSTGPVIQDNARPVDEQTGMSAPSCDYNLLDGGND